MKTDAAGLALLIVALGGCTSGWVGTPDPIPSPLRAASSPIATLRVVQSSSRTSVGFDKLVAAASNADVVFFGEEHDDPETHFAEFALLEGIGRQRVRVVLSLEMFERDVQATLDDYLAGKISEAEFLANSRPWPRYERDYRPLVVLARARGWAVRAANVPRPIASLVSKKGLGAIDSLPDGSKGWVAKNFVCAHDAYFDRFAHAMTGHSGGGDPAPAADPAEMLATTNRFYEAQCVKDETMAESIANVFGRGVPGFSAPADPEPIVVHITGSFHSDYRQGTVDRTLRRRPDLRCIVITSVPSAHPAAEPISDAGARADYVIFTKKIGDATGK